jgi:endonuclease G, mitochondrial
MSPYNKARLSIRGIDGLTQVRLLDARFERVPLEANTGQMDLLVEPGIYEVGFRRGSVWQSRAVIVPPDAETVFVEPLDLEPEVPAAETPVIADAAAQDGASVVVELTGPNGGLVDPVQADLLQVTLMDEAGEVACPLYPRPLVPGTWRFSVPPGMWRLRVDDRAARQPFELPAAIPSGWSLHFAFRSAVREGSLQFDLNELRVAMLRPGAGTPRLDRRLAEDAAMAALSGRQALYGEGLRGIADDLVDDKADNPMLGLFAAHLLAGDRGATQEHLDRIAERLDRLTRQSAEQSGATAAPRHPDVAALRLRLKLLFGESLDDEPPLPFPPLLAAGWRALLEAAAVKPELIPPGSVTERIAALLWSSDLWVAWSASALDAGGSAAPEAGERSLPSIAEEEAGPPMPFERARRLIVAGLAHAQLRQWYRTRQATCFTVRDAATPAADFMPVEEVAVAAALRAVQTDEEGEAKILKIQLCLPRAADIETDSRTLAAKLGLSRAVVERASSSLARRLHVEAARLGIDLERRMDMARPELTIPYDPAFLGDGFVVPLPQLGGSALAASLAEGAVIDYTHFSLVMHRDRRTALYTANNIDAARKVAVSGGLTWQMDERVGEHQIGRETYDGNQIDKGHLVRREDVLWGSVPEARAANKATYFYPNAAPQHQNFNQDEWKNLEDWVLERATDHSYRLCVFTGPVLTDSDPTLADLPPELRELTAAWGPAQLPAAFWKIIVVRDAEAGGDDLAVIAFAMKQSEMWTDRHGSRLLNLRVHQVTIKAIEEWTGLDFGILRELDALAFGPTRGVEDETSPWPEIRSAGDLVWSGAERRSSGVRALRGEGGSAPAERALADRVAASAGGCGCGEREFDARGAIEALARDVARLTDAVARAPSVAAGGGERGLTDADSEGDDGLAAPDDPRVEEIVAAAPDDMKDEVRMFARTVIGQGDISRGLRPPPEPRELQRIVGGDLVQAGGFPHCVCIGEPDRWMCTGALIAPQVVLTAAHCGGAISRIMAGGNSVLPSVDGRTVTVRRVHVHPAYRGRPYHENDMTLLILAAPALVPPVPIATELELLGAEQVVLAGFGRNDPQRPLGFGLKRWATIPLRPTMRRPGQGDMAELEQKLGFHADYEFVCGRKGLGKDSCNGDSGGPAYVRSGGDFRLAGLTSRATREAVVNCGDGGIYVRPERFRGWIDTVVHGAGLPPIAW